MEEEQEAHLDDGWGSERVGKSVREFMVRIGERSRSHGAFRQASISILADWALHPQREGLESMIKTILTY